MAVPFTPFRVCRFLALWLLAFAAVYGIFMLLMHMRARQSIAPSRGSVSQIFPSGESRAAALPCRPAFQPQTL